MRQPGIAGRTAHVPALDLDRSRRGNRCRPISPKAPRLQLAHRVGAYRSSSTPARQGTSPPLWRAPGFRLARGCRTRPPIPIWPLPCDCQPGCWLSSDELPATAQPLPLAFVCHVQLLGAGLVRPFAATVITARPMLVARREAIRVPVGASKKSAARPKAHGASSWWRTHWRLDWQIRLAASLDVRRRSRPIPARSLTTACHVYGAPIFRALAGPPHNSTATYSAQTPPLNCLAQGFQ